MTKVKDIIQYLEKIAPFSLQESYDNSGLLVGNNNNLVTGFLVSLDCTEAVVQEAIDNNVNTIISHHPIIFSGLKQLTGKTYIERTVIKAIQNNINLIAIHTNLDHVMHGVNGKIADKINLTNRKILSPKSNLLKLVTFVPEENSDNLLEALGKAGAGQIGNYENCSFQSSGIGTFKPNEYSNPTVGEKGNLEKVKEKRIEVIFPNHLKSKILNTLKSVHPYEEVAYYLHDTLNKNQDVGSGMVGELENEIETLEFLYFLKKEFNLHTIKHTPLLKNKIKKIAICGGSGSFLLGNAKAKSADLFITADFKYHEYFDHEDKIVIADIGHYESEVFTKDLLCEILREKFTNIAVVLSKTNTNPILYL